MAHEKVYVQCENLCLEEGMTKDQIEGTFATKEVVQNLASGSPKGSYATTSALVSANPASGVYVVTEDGHLYSWTKNASAAIDLGTYQATQIGDNSVHPVMTTFFENKSIMPQSGWEKGKVFSNSNGQPTNYNGCLNMTYISVTPSEKIYVVQNTILSLSTIHVTEYDENYDFIKDNIISVYKYILTPTANTKYIRFCCWTGNQFNNVPDNAPLFLRANDYNELTQYDTTSSLKDLFTKKTSLEKIFIPNKYNFRLLHYLYSYNVNFLNRINDIYETKISFGSSGSTSYVGPYLYANNVNIGDSIFLEISSTQPFEDVRLFDNGSAIGNFTNIRDNIYKITIDENIKNLLSTGTLYIAIKYINMNTSCDLSITAYINENATTVTNYINTYVNSKINNPPINAMFLGDSITALTGSRSWIEYFKEIISTDTVTNVAVSGAILRDNTNTVYDGNPTTSDSENNVLGNQVQKILNNNYSAPDVIFIAIGTNAGINCTEQQMYDNYYDSEGNLIPLENVNRKHNAGAFRYANETLHNKYPNAMIIWCTPIQAANGSRNVQSIISWGNNLKMMCSYASCYCIDTEKCGIVSSNEIKSQAGEYLQDGLHPNAAGAKLMGQYNASEFGKFLNKIIRNKA